MDPEAPLRWMVLILFGSGLCASVTLRRRADRDGGAMPRSADGKPVAVALGLAGGLFYGSLAAWLIHPPLVAGAAVAIPVAVRWAGVVLIGAGLALGLWSLRHLGRSVTPTAAVREDTELVTSGPYRYVRHPLYSSMLLTVPGCGLASANVLVLAAGLATFTVILVRTGREEEELARRFGERYRTYRDRTGRIVPRFGRGRDAG